MGWSDRLQRTLEAETNLSKPGMYPSGVNLGSCANPHLGKDILDRLPDELLLNIANKLSQSDGMSFH